jgi:hypothetical protein
MVAQFVSVLELAECSTIVAWREPFMQTRRAEDGTMRTLEFWARLTPDRTLEVPPEVASRIQGDDPVRVVVVLPDDDERAWSDLTAEQFLGGYDASDALYDDLPTR